MSQDGDKTGILLELKLAWLYFCNGWRRIWSSPVWRFLAGREDAAEPPAAERPAAQPCIPSPPVERKPPDAPVPPSGEPERGEEDAPSMTEDEMLLAQYKASVEEMRKGQQLRQRLKEMKRLEPPEREEEESAEADEAAPAPDVSSAAAERPAYQLPSVELLQEVPVSSEVDVAEIEERKRQIQDCLDSFWIDADVGEAIHGPQVTLYQVHRGEGVPCNVFPAHEKELLAALKAKTIRILAPVPNTNYIGIEVPNIRRETVWARELFGGGTWRECKGTLPLVLGKDIVGNHVLMDLGEATHLLIAGTTGSGKSVGLHACICSLLMRFAPDELKMILVDPKFVEFAAYKELPHLLVPVIVEMERVGDALRWMVREMETRYQWMRQVGVRSLEEYNRRPRTTEPVLDETTGAPLPDKLEYIVLVMDELADMMSDPRVRKETEVSLQRLAQKGRATGFHVIVATQRPGVDVLSGGIKANFPARIAFHCASAVDSVTVLGCKGAELLMGNGDMLLGGSLKRLQGVFLKDEEIAALVKHWATQGAMVESYDILKTAEPPKEPSAEEKRQLKEDELLKEAVRVILEGKATTSYVQRRLGIGYNRAAGLLEALESAGIVGPEISGSKTGREILVESPEEAMARLDAGAPRV